MDMLLFRTFSSPLEKTLFSCFCVLFLEEPYLEDVMVKF